MAGANAGGDQGRLSHGRSLAAPLALGALLTALAFSAVRSAQAIPRLDLRPYPAPAADELRWVIQLPGLLPPTRDPSLSPDPADWRVQLIVGKTVPVDCNLHRLGGKLKPETIPGWGYTLFRLKDVGPMLSTRKGCPPGEPPTPQFVVAGSKPFVVPYNASLPIVVYTPRGYELRWRIWKAERESRSARQL
ncbi:ecotin [Cyanobium sp. Morenito 9A2]|uniref:ecotin n=1 Tax=Cyanobium sp. Morenito 9A2 TaxID=2823718 RepID=UPI0020CEE949|nr:ecotin family protein [Cyanobium sp. Morenito 9A2]MCP9850461.1 ecotin family protein [Cyanobium sp. Morenito 9A2]